VNGPADGGLPLRTAKPHTARRRHKRGGVNAFRDGERLPDDPGLSTIDGLANEEAGGSSTCGPGNHGRPDLSIAVDRVVELVQAEEQAGREPGARANRKADPSPLRG
jgi:hypothetical protein